MNFKINIQTVLLAAAIGLIAWLLLRPKASAPVQQVRRSILRTKYRLTPTAEQALKCKYRLATGQPTGTKVTDVINERMAMLQANEADLNTLIGHGQSQGWDAYETVYHEAISTLVQEGLIYPDGTLCAIAGGGSISVSTATP